MSEGKYPQQIAQQQMRGAGMAALLPADHGAVVSPVQSGREILLDAARKCVLQDRNRTYGNPADNFNNIARFWNEYFWQKDPGSKYKELVTAQDVAHMMILMKMARLTTNSGHFDSLVDIAGYAACAADCQNTNSAN